MYCLGLEFAQWTGYDNSSASIECTWLLRLYFLPFTESILVNCIFLKNCIKLYFFKEFYLSYIIYRGFPCGSDGKVSLRYSVMVLLLSLGSLILLCCWFLISFCSGQKIFSELFQNYLYGKTYGPPWWMFHKKIKWIFWAIRWGSINVD